MHILILADPVDNQKAGVHVYTKNLILEFCSASGKSLKFTFVHEKENFFFNKLQKKHPNCSHIIIPRKKIPGYNSLRKFILIPKTIRRIKPDTVLEPCHIGPFNIPKNIKRAVVIHDMTPILFPQFHIKKSTIIHKLLLKKILKKADLIITASEQNKKDILSYCDTKAKIEVIPLGLPGKKTSPGTPSSKTTSDPYVLYLGTIEPRKNLELLMDAFTEVKKENNLPHNLILAGGIGWKAEKIVEKAKNLPNVILPGYVDDEEKEKLYKNAAVFVYPSLYEGFGLPPMEALQHGTPVICSTGGALKEVYKNRASLFDPQDKQKLKSLLLKHIKKNKRNLAQKIPTFEKTAQTTLKALLK